MKTIQEIYRTIVEAVYRASAIDPVMMFSCNKERYVDARGLLITVLIEYKFSESRISELTGLSQQAVNRLKNIYPDRIRHQFLLFCTLQQIRHELTISLQQDSMWHSMPTGTTRS